MCQSVDFSFAFVTIHSDLRTLCCCPIVYNTHHVVMLLLQDNTVQNKTDSNMRSVCHCQLAEWEARAVTGGTWQG